MAQVRSVNKGTVGRAAPHRTEVDCDWIRVDSANGPLLQISSFGSDERKNPGKSSQTLQFSRGAALELLAAIDAVFPGLGRRST